MSLSEKNRLYQKFLVGNISAEEMHVLNQYALDDDFLFDAIEGATVYDSDVSRSMLELEERLSAKKAKRKRPLWVWFSAAASVAILVIAIGMWNPMDEKVMADVVSEKEPAIELDDDVEMDGKMAVVETEIPPVVEESVVARKEVSEDLADTPTSQTAPESAIPEPPAAVAVAPAAGIESDEVVLQQLPAREIATVAPTKPEDAESNEFKSEEESITLDEIDVLGEARPQRAATENKVSNLSVLSRKENGRKAKKRERESAGQAFTPPAQERLSQPSITFKVEIQADTLNSLTLQQYLYNFYPISEASGLISMRVQVENGVRTSGVEIIDSLNSSLDDKIRQYVESFEEWQGSGNKTVIIRFTKGGQ